MLYEDFLDLDTAPTSSAPFYICQTSAPMGDEERTAWVMNRIKEAQSVGATWCRYSHHPYHPQLGIVEGWTERPAVEPVPQWNLYLAGAHMLYLGPKEPST